mgnify:CR=1 FL=1
MKLHRNATIGPDQHDHTSLPQLLEFGFERGFSTRGKLKIRQLSGMLYGLFDIRNHRVRKVEMPGIIVEHLRVAHDIVIALLKQLVVAGTKRTSMKLDAIRAGQARKLISNIELLPTLLRVCRGNLLLRKWLLKKLQLKSV